MSNGQDSVFTCYKLHIIKVNCNIYNVTENIVSAYIIDAVRTPIGRYGGSLSGIRTDDLAALPIGELVRRHPDFDWENLDDVIFGDANQAGEDNRNVARMAALLAGLPTSVP